MSDKLDFDSTEQDAVPMVEEQQETAIAKQYSAGFLLNQGIQKGLDIESMKELIALKNREEDRMARKEFHEHFQEMQKEYPIVKKTKPVFSKGGDVVYKYAPLEDILELYAPILAKHGFSYNWTEEKTESNLKNITCTISGYGHSEKATVEIPIESGNGFTSNIQQRGSSTSYGKRYSFCDVVGVIIAGEDDEEKLLYEDGVQYSEPIQFIRECQDMDSLKEVWTGVLEQFKGDKNAIRILSIEKDRKKKELSGGANV